EIAREQERRHADPTDQIAEGELQEPEVAAGRDTGDGDHRQGGGLGRDDRQHDGPPGQAAVAEEVVARVALAPREHQAEDDDGGAFDHEVVRGGLVFDAQAVAEPRAPARQHADPQAGGLGGDLLLRHELAHLDRRGVGQGQGDGSRALRRRHCDPPVTCELRKSRRPCQLSPPEARALMRLTLADWLVVALYFLFNIGVGLYYKRRAGRSTAEYFLSGRNVPGWLAGTSMVATTFAADTPLVVTGLVARNGGPGHWLWWNLLASGMLTVFFHA